MDDQKFGCLVQTIDRSLNTRMKTVDLGPLHLTHQALVNTNMHSNGLTGSKWLSSVEGFSFWYNIANRGIPSWV